MKGNMRKGVIVGVFALTLAVAAMVPTAAFAATTGSTTVTFTGSSDNLSVTVPTTIPISVAGVDGTFTGPTPSAAQIKNTSVFGIHVSSLQVAVASGFNLVTSAAYSAASTDNTYWLTLKPNSGTAIETANYTTATAISSTDWNLARLNGTIDITTAGAIKNITKNLSDTPMTAATLNWTFISGTV